MFAMELFFVFAIQGAVGLLQTFVGSFVLDAISWLLGC